MRKGKGVVRGVVCLASFFFKGVFDMGKVKRVKIKRMIKKRNNDILFPISVCLLMIAIALIGDVNSIDVFFAGVFITMLTTLIVIWSCYVREIEVVEYAELI